MEDARHPAPTRPSNMSAPLSKCQVGFLGGGAMAEAIFRGLIRSNALAPANIYVFDIFAARRDALTAMQLGINVASSVEALLDKSNIVVLATKPDVVPAALASCQAGWKSDKLLLSICAGVKIETLGSSIAMPRARVVRAMPNLPCLVNEAATAICWNGYCSEQDRENAMAILTSVGVVERVPETLMDAATGFSGSGPGFVFMFIEAMADAAVLNGVPRMAARKLAAQVVYGSAKMALDEPGTHPADLRNRVESPGGTTIAGTQALEAAGFRAAVVAAVTAATKRSSELGAKQ
jgi:pyrroline-5-carboxylate reductase